MSMYDRLIGYVRRNEWIVYLALTIVAILTRVYGIWEWSFNGDEVYTVKHAGERWDNLSNPAYYALVVLVKNTIGLTNWSVRLPAVVLAVLSVPVFYFLCAKVVDRTTAGIATIVLLVSDWHLLFSQYARFYSGIFLFGSISYFVYYLSLRKDSVGLFLAAFISVIVGIAFHTTFIVVPAACAVVSAAVWWSPRSYSGALSKRIARYYFLASCTIGLILLPFLVHELNEWWALHPSAGVAGLASLRALIGTSLDFVNRVGMVLSAAAGFGFYYLFTDRFRLGVLFGISMLVPLILYYVASELAPPARPRYVFSIFPLVIASAGYLCARIAASAANYGAARHAVLILILAGMAPGFISYYTNKQSLDASDVVNVVEQRRDPSDKVLAMPIGVDYKIESEYPGWQLIERGEGWKDRVERSISAGDQVWIIAPSSSIPGVGAERDNWLMEHGSLKWQRYAFGYVRAMPGMSVWFVENRKAHLGNGD